MKPKSPSPTMKPEITEENYKRAVTAASGACLVADAIKEQYPQFSHVSVDAATIRISDRKRGERYIYLTPPSVGEMLLAFDQGWLEKDLPKKLLIRRAVKITPICVSASNVKARAEQRAKRLEEIRTKEQSGESLSGDEKRYLARLHKEPVSRPTHYGPSKVEGEGENIVVRGGAPTKHVHNPNLLHGRTRHFGWKTAQPSEVFKRAVKQAVKEDRAKRKGKSESK